MRQIISFNSAKGFYIDKNKIIYQLREISNKLIKKFPEIKEIHLFGSLANNNYTGLSDIDLLIIIQDSKEKNPLERVKPYYFYLSDYIPISFDLLVCTVKESKINNFYKNILSNSIKLS
jgi:predicted nucleotidyltransferase